MKNLSVILLAGGKGTRMNSTIPKQYLTLNGKPIVSYSFELLKTLPNLKEIIVVCEESYLSFFETASSIPVLFALPGLRRQDSVYNGLQKVSGDTDLVCIHDGARPFLDKSCVLEAIKEAILHGASALAVPVNSTIKEVNDHGLVTRTLERSNLFEIQTPQIIEFQLLKKSFKKCIEMDWNVTDDVSLVEQFGKPVKLVLSTYQNIKITTSNDLAIASNILETQHG